MIPPRLKWTKIITNESPPARKLAGSVVYQDQLYIHGGYGNNGLLDDFWSYNFENNTFQQIKLSSPRKPCARFGHSIVVYEKENAIYLFGGTKGTSIGRDGLNDLWKYDIKKKKWKEIDQYDCCPPPERYCFVSFIHDEKLFLFGGYGCANYKLYTFDFEYQTWEDIELKGINSINFAWVKHGNNVYLYDENNSYFKKFNLNDFQCTILECARIICTFSVDTIKKKLEKKYRNANDILPSDLFCYNISTNIWLKMNGNDEIKHFPSFCVWQKYKNKFYVFGGSKIQFNTGSSSWNFQDCLSSSTGHSATNDFCRLQITPVILDQSTCVANDLRLLINNPDCADVCFVIEGKKIHAHKNNLYFGFVQ